VRSSWICLLLLLGPAVADAGTNPACGADCADIVQAVSSQSAGAVTDGQSVRLMGDADDPTINCRRLPCEAKPGLTGVLLQQADSQVYVSLPDKGKINTVEGWIPASRWRATDSSPQPLDRWVGVWQNEVGKITIQQANATQLHMTGSAIWGRPDNPHFGDFDVTEAPKDGVVLGSEGGCKIALRLLGDYLVVADNGSCGALNVRFNGMYRFRHR
jgi:hypothetical protein